VDLQGITKNKRAAPAPSTIGWIGPNFHSIIRSSLLATLPSIAMRFSLALLALAASASAFDVPSLTPENYDEKTEGKTVFIKFFAPWVRYADRRTLG
jgi:hypothetical protein